MYSFQERIKHAWDAFMNKDPTVNNQPYFSSNPFKTRLTNGNERTIVTSIYNRIAVDVSLVNIRHIRVDENEKYLESIKSNLNRCLTIEANNDQTGRNLIQDLVLRMCNDGYVAVVPTSTSFNPNNGDGFDILKLRCCKILGWYPNHVRVNVYRENISQYRELVLKKDMVAIIENPFYNVMNEPNGTAKRLIRKLAVLDSLDDKMINGKLDILFRLPYTLKSDLRKQQAEERKKELEEQMTGKLGIGYIDQTEDVIQLNKPIENNLLSQVEYLTRMLFSQLGINEKILNGEANEQELLNYSSHTIEPILTAISEEFIRKFLSKTAITQGQRIWFFKDPFKLVPINNVANIADTFARNEIMTANEIRSVIGLKPSSDPNANELRNKNLYKEEI